MSTLVSDYLRVAGYEPRCMADGLAVVDAFKAAPYDLILPGRDGFEICRELRSFSDVPIVMLTSTWAPMTTSARRRSARARRVARVKAVLRRSRKESDSEPPKLQVDEDGYRARYNGVALDLRPIEFRLLKTLAATPGRVFSRNALLDQLHADHRAVTDRAVDSHVKNLRRKLEQADASQECIRSIYGVGYRFDA